MKKQAELAIRATILPDSPGNERKILDKKIKRLDDAQRMVSRLVMIAVARESCISNNGGQALE